MTKIISNTCVNAYDNRLYITKILLAFSVFMAIVYAFNMYSTIKYTLAAENIEKAATSLEASVQDLDTKYIELSNKISPEMAKKYGLHQGEVTAYISKPTSLGRVQASIKGI